MCKDNPCALRIPNVWFERGSAPQIQKALDALDEAQRPVTKRSASHVQPNTLHGSSGNGLSVGANQIQ
jgi:hypothetical protein